MRLFLPVLLVTLALGCQEANAKACPAVISEMISQILDSKIVFTVKTLKFLPPVDAIESMLKVKTCIDKISYVDREIIAHFLVKIQNTCNSGFPTSSPTTVSVAQ
ncbi:PREDICTED: secretoglobin family 1D member 2 [Miniopterus natalensis]|uniref:secretoglobin family 1D member 2 n=1 Tax=Miniopterus natalensis TaxID=291302 RepID=UPI0007A6FF07|nr:PREDICTED: secretoglobin family 1D member 2 [Miniopterus natalensis]